MQNDRASRSAANGYDRSRRRMHHAPIRSANHGNDDRHVRLSNRSKSVLFCMSLKNLWAERLFGGFSVPCRISKFDAYTAAAQQNDIATCQWAGLYAYVGSIEKGSIFALEIGEDD